MSTRDLSRRAFLSMSAAAPFAFSAALHGQKKIPVGLELYSVRGELAKDLLGTVAAVGKMGYQVVEFYAPYMQWTPDRAKEVRKVLDDNGLKCPSTHNGVQSLTADGLQKAIELNQIIGSKYIIIASSPAKTADEWKAFAGQLSQASAQLKAAGMATGFHNHAIEWKPVDGQRPMDILAANTPGDVVLQFDVGTCLEAGADPIAWINAHPGRIKSAHCKDWAPDRGYNVAFGEGTAPWKPLLDALEKTGGVEYYLIEQETGAQQDGELPMVQRCLANWKKLGR
ncbi:MAG TPA: sugar phosphate isomerase/epimerase [Vicinamibacterales bacterium]|nr:sugar phosphate isomerase/epimerase [Vicinamibacterales bacterium]